MFFILRKKLWKTFAKLLGSYSWLALDIFGLVSRLVSQVVYSQPPRLFCFLFNVFSKISLYDSKVSVAYESGVYRVSGFIDAHPITHSYRNQKLCYLHMVDGFNQRVRILRRQYHLDQVPLQDGDVILDCGANVGDLYLCFIGKNINYIAFEPAPDEYDCLKSNCPTSICHQIALWNEDTSLQFFLSPAGGDSSLIVPPAYDSATTTNAKRLESFIENYPTIKLLKLEAEGAEPEVLEGLGGSLKKIVYITADLGFERGIRCESTLPTVSSYLISRGFNMISLDPSRFIALFVNSNFNN